MRFHNILLINVRYFYKRKLNIGSTRLKNCVPKIPHREAKHKTIIAKLNESPVKSCNLYHVLKKAKLSGFEI